MSARLQQCFIRPNLRTSSGRSTWWKGKGSSLQDSGFLTGFSNKVSQMEQPPRNFYSSEFQRTLFCAAHSLSVVDVMSTHQIVQTAVLFKTCTAPIIIMHSLDFKWVLPFAYLWLPLMGAYISGCQRRRNGTLAGYETSAGECVSGVTV